MNEQPAIDLHLSRGYTHLCNPYVVFLCGIKNERDLVSEVSSFLLLVFLMERCLLRMKLKSKREGTCLQSSSPACPFTKAQK